jgi:hypothetical protein
MHFTNVGDVTEVETIAHVRGIRTLAQLRAEYGGRNWRKRKMKGIAMVELANGKRRLAEIHWYEAHGVGRKKFKIKRFLD